MPKETPKGKSLYAPVILAIIIGVLLVGYSFYSHSTGTPPERPAGGAGMPPHEHEEGLELFKTMGTIAVILGGISFMWLRFKKKLASPSVPVKKLGRFLYRIHQLTGWAALVLILVHGTYYLLQQKKIEDIYTGLAAFLFLLLLAVYGLMIRKTKKPALKKVHFTLSVAWIPFLLVHAGGSAITTVIASVVVWFFIGFLEKWTQTAKTA